ncbi:MAG: sensor histidine kinase [Burkholderiales bacterium]
MNTRSPTVPTRPVAADACADEALRALDALGLWVARLDGGGERVAWCAAALSDRFPDWRAGRAVAALEPEFRGLSGALAAHRAGGASPHALTGRDGRPLSVTLRDAGADAIAVMLADPAADAEAAARHLGDRERLLFLSRSLSVGELASTLAHELNQPIGSIVNLLRGLSKRMERGVTDPRQLSAAVDQGIEQAVYAAGILARVREYVQPRRPRRESIRLPALVASAVSLLDWEVARDGIALELDGVACVAEPMVLGDPVMLQQVIVNLARNAIEAMRAVPADERRLRVRTESEDEEVVLRIEDRGHGLDAEAAQRLFTPFFTTKPDGTGLGLHVCRSIVELHGGRLWFEPAADRGCVACVALPVAGAEVTS